VQALQYVGEGEVRWQEVPTPRPGAGEVLLETRLAGFNHRDVWLVRGDFGVHPPYTLLSDGVGRVVAVGPGVAEELVGQDMVINPSVGCGHCLACARGDEPACPSFRIFDGAAAELVRVPAANLVPKPDGLPDEVAGTVGLVFLTAYDMVVERARVEAGERVLVWGATGGLGSAAVQVVRHVGGEAVAVGGDRAYLSGLGAAHVVTRGTLHLAEELEALGPFDVVLDSVGRETFALSLRLLRRGGRLVTVGATSGGAVELALGDVFRRRIAVLGAFMGSRAHLWRLLPLIADGRLRPPPVEVVRREEAAQALRRLAQGGVRGKIGLRIR
jgi:NADPH:quinone reductase-like Zn-dependent oxidoreductase